MKCVGFSCLFPNGLFQYVWYVISESVENCVSLLFRLYFIFYCVGRFLLNMSSVSLFVADWYGILCALFYCMAHILVLPVVKCVALYVLMSWMVWVLDCNNVELSSLCLTYINLGLPESNLGIAEWKLEARRTKIGDSPNQNWRLVLLITNIN